MCSCSRRRASFRVLSLSSAMFDGLRSSKSNAKATRARGRPVASATRSAAVSFRCALARASRMALRVARRALLAATFPRRPSGSTGVRTRVSRLRIDWLAWWRVRIVGIPHASAHDATHLVAHVQDAWMVLSQFRPEPLAERQGASARMPSTSRVEPASALHGPCRVGSCSWSDGTRQTSWPRLHREC